MKSLQPRAYIIEPTGAEWERLPDNGRAFTLQEMQDAVGGFIEVLFLGPQRVVLNEHGKLDGLPINPKATERFAQHLVPGDYLVGPVLVCESRMIE